MLIPAPPRLASALFWVSANVGQSSAKISQPHAQVPALLMLRDIENTVQATCANSEPPIVQFTIQLLRGEKMTAGLQA